MTTDEKNLLEEIRNQNSMILARLARVEEFMGEPAQSSDAQPQLNMSEMLRADDPVAYLRDRNRQIKASGKLRKRKDTGR